MRENYVQIGINIRESSMDKLRKIARKLSDEEMRVTNSVGHTRIIRKRVTQSDVIEMGIEALEREFAKSVPITPGDPAEDADYDELTEDAPKELKI